MSDWIEFDEDADAVELDTVDGFVLTGRVRFKQLSHCGGYLAAYHEGGEGEDRFNVWAEPVSRAERARRLEAGQDRLIDHLGCLLPWRWRTSHPRWCGWAIPIHRRPAAAIRDWWTARCYAGVALVVKEEE